MPPQPPPGFVLVDRSRPPPPSSPTDLSGGGAASVGSGTRRSVARSAATEAASAGVGFADIPPPPPEGFEIVQPEAETTQRAGRRRGFGGRGGASNVPEEFARGIPQGVARLLGSPADILQSLGLDQSAGALLQAVGATGPIGRLTTDIGTRASPTSEELSEGVFSPIISERPEAGTPEAAARTAGEIFGENVIPAQALRNAGRRAVSEGARALPETVGVFRRFVRESLENIGRNPRAFAVTETGAGAGQTVGRLLGQDIAPDSPAAQAALELGLAFFGGVGAFRAAGAPRARALSPEDLDQTAAVDDLVDVDLADAAGRPVTAADARRTIASGEAPPDIGNASARQQEFNFGDAPQGPTAGITPEQVLERPTTPGGAARIELGPEGEVARVGGINISRLETVDDISGTFAEIERAIPRGPRLETISNAETERLAEQMGMTFEELTRRRDGVAFNATEIQAAGQMLTDGADDVVALARAARDGTDADLMRFNQGVARQGAIQDQFRNVQAEAGRALQVLSRAIKSDRVQVIEQAMESMGGREGAEQLADIIVAHADDPAAINRITRDAVRPGFLDKAQSLWYNMILSGPWTHARNIIGNSIFNVVSLAEHGVASGVGALRRGSDRVTFSEVMARVNGSMQGALEGVPAGGRAFVAGEASDLTSKIELNRSTAFTGPASFVVEAPGRALLAEDEFFKSIARVSDIRGMAWRNALSEGLEGDALAARARELTNNPTDDMVDAAGEFARELTFQEKLGPLGRAIQNARTIKPGDSPGTMALRLAARITVPFVRTPINLVRTAARRTPVGLLSNRNIKDFRAGGARRDLAIARVGMGTGVTALLYNMAANQLLSGNGPSDFRKRADLQASGWRPNAVRVGDRWITYRGLDPFAITAGTIASLVENTGDHGDDEWGDIATNMIFETADNLTDQTWLSGLNSLVQAVNDPERYADSFAARQLTSFVVPAVLRGVNQSQVDPVLRSTRGDTFSERLENTIRASVPGLSSDLVARHDVYGRVIEREGSAGPDLLSPLFESTIDTDPVIVEVGRLGELTTSAVIGLPGRSVSVTQPDGSRRRETLDEARYQEYLRVSGTFILEDLREFMDSPDYQEMGDADRLDEIRDIRTAAREDAREELFRQPVGPPAGFELQNEPPEGFILQE